MECERCKRPVLPLFTGVVCEYCDAPAPEAPYQAFIVLDVERLEKDLEFYLFPTRLDAARYRSLRRLMHLPLAKVDSYDPIEWQPSRGLLRGFSLARHRFRVHRDHRYPAHERRVHLVQPTEARRVA